MNNLISFRQLSANLTSYAERVKKNNENFIILKKSKPIFKISPIDEDVWETVVDFSSISHDGAPIAKVKAAITRILNQ
jgi:antitoxin (DNA-binding transcriptional repressor) of toxin-antitoxin stability system